MSDQEKDETFMGLKIHRDWRTVKSYPAKPDGQPVDVQVVHLPAVFCRIVVHPCDGLTGNKKPGFVLTTGTEMLELSHAIARAVSDGMLGLHLPVRRQAHAQGQGRQVTVGPLLDTDDFWCPPAPRAKGGK